MHSILCVVGIFSIPIPIYSQITDIPVSSYTLLTRSCILVIYMLLRTVETALVLSTFLVTATQLIGAGPSTFRYYLSSESTTRALTV